MSRALIYSDSRPGKPVYGKVGDRRWECEWYQFTTAAKRRAEADPDYETDHDRDVTCLVTIHATKADAIIKGQSVAGDSVYGCAIVQEHVLDWFVEEDNVADWEAYGHQFEVIDDGTVSEI